MLRILVLLRRLVDEVGCVAARSRPVGVEVPGCETKRVSEALEEASGVVVVNFRRFASAAWRACALFWLLYQQSMYSSRATWFRSSTDSAFPSASTDIIPLWRPYLLATQWGQLFTRIGHLVDGVDCRRVCSAQSYASAYTGSLRGFPAGGVSDNTHSALLLMVLGSLAPDCTDA